MNFNYAFHCSCCAFWFTLGIYGKVDKLPPLIGSLVHGSSKFMVIHAKVGNFFWGPPKALRLNDLKWNRKTWRNKLLIGGLEISVVVVGKSKVNCLWCTFPRWLWNSLTSQRQCGRRQAMQTTKQQIRVIKLWNTHFSPALIFTVALLNHKSFELEIHEQTITAKVRRTAEK